MSTSSSGRLLNSHPVAVHSPHVWGTMSPPLADTTSDNLRAAMTREPVASLPNTIACPKRPRPSSGYHYYPGYSRLFVREILSNWPKSAVVLDPWNGSGTTTTVAAEMGFDCIGIDLNPAMVVIAKSNLLDDDAVSTIRARSTAIRSQPIGPPEHDPSDPLLEWLDEASAARVRTLLRALVGSPRLTAEQADDLGPVEAYWLKTLFQVIVNATRPWRTTNPTWIKSRGSLPPATVSWNSLLASVATAATGASPIPKPGPVTARVVLGDSTDLVAHHTHPDLILGITAVLHADRLRGCNSCRTLRPGAIAVRTIRTSPHADRHNDGAPIP